MVTRSMMVAAAAVVLLSSSYADAASDRWGLIPARVSANLVQNGSAEEPQPAGAQVPHWTAPCRRGFCRNWQSITQQACGPSLCLPALEGTRYFYAGVASYVDGLTGSTELFQDVDLSPYADSIDAGNQAFEFKVSITTLTPDAGRVVVEYRNILGVPLATVDTGDVYSVSSWSTQSDMRLAPVGTRSVRVRLVSKRLGGSSYDAFFDDISLRALVEGEPMKAVYFFPGKPPYENPPEYVYGVDREQLQRWWTQEPVSDAYLLWSVHAASRAQILGDIAGVQANAVVMSFWGESTPQQAGPMKPVWPDDYDKLFQTVVEMPGQPIRVLPAIEGLVLSGDEVACAKQPSRDLSGSLASSTGYLSDRISALVGRYYNNPAHPEWRSMWQTMFDAEGSPRLAVNLLHVASALAVRGDDSGSASALAARLDEIADSVTAQHGLPIKIGFTIDPYSPNCAAADGTPLGYTPQSKDAAWFMGTDPNGGVHGRSLLAIQGFNPEVTNPICRRSEGPMTLPDPFCNPQGASLGVPVDACYEEWIRETWVGANTCTDNNNQSPRGPTVIERGKRDWIAGWVEAGVPTVLDVSSGYDGHRTFFDTGTMTVGHAGIYGDNSWTGIHDSWRNHQSAMKRHYAGRRSVVGLVYNAWNGFAEGFAAAPSYFVRHQYTGLHGPYFSAWYWLYTQFTGDPRDCDHHQFVNGEPSGGHTFGAICDLWQCLGAEDAFGAPVTDQVLTADAGGWVTHFEGGGSIYWSATTLGTHAVYGAINATYRAAGEELSGLGLPVSDEVDGPPGTRVSYFEHGHIYWVAPEVGAHIVIDSPWASHPDMGNACGP